MSVRVLRQAAPFALASAALALVLVAGCGKPAPEYPARVAANGVARLPATPELHPPVVPERHPDSAWSVHGLLEADRGSLEGEQEVRGTIAAMQPCPVGQKVCNPAPHLYLTDATSGQGRRLLVGGERDLEARGWKVGQLITVRGTFATSSPDGLYFAPQGMLLLAPVVDVDAVSTGARP